MQLGLQIIPTFNTESIPAIKQSIPKDASILSNYKVGLPHHFLRITDQPNTIYGSTDIHVSPATSTLDLSDKLQKQIFITQALLERSDRMLMVFPSEISVHPLLILLSMGTKPTRVIVGSDVWEPDRVRQFISSCDQDLLRKQFNEIFTIRPEKRYSEDELTKTPNGATLRQYQQQMVDFAIANRRVGLFVDMGLGKTLATLATIDTLHKSGQLDTRKPILIVAPITVALDTWVREADKWGYDMNVLVNIGLSKKKRELLLDEAVKPHEKVTLMTTNPHQLEPMFNYFDSKNIKNPFQMIIVDELSMFKNINARRTSLLVDRAKSVDFFIGLTGTPAPNNLMDIYSQLVLISPVNFKHFGSNFFEYRNKFFDPAWVDPRSGQVYEYKLKPGAENEIYKRMKKTVISMRSVGLVDLPSITYSNIYVDLPPKAKKLYDQAVKEFSENSDDGISIDLTFGEAVSGKGVGDVDIVNAGVLTGKLLQLANGAMYKQDDLDERSYTVFHSAKMDALKDLVEASTSPILLFYQFQSDLDRMGDYIKFEHLEPTASNFRDTISRWNKGEIPVLAAHPASAGHGLNLQDGGHTIVWLSPTWSNEIYRQANKRLHRSGQKNPVSVIHILAKNTKDEDVIDALDTKEEGQDKLMTELDIAIR